MANSSASNSIVSVFFDRAKQRAEFPFIRYKEGRGPYRDLNWTEFSSLVRQMAYGLAACGLESRKQAAILSQTSHLFMAADLAIMANGAVSVPLYPTSSKADIVFILNNSEADVLFVQNETLLKKVLAVKDELPNLQKIVLLTALSGGKSLSELECPPEYVIGLEELRELGRTHMASKEGLIETRISQIKPSDIATIIYTSGTTGTPKGVILTHSNITSILAIVPTAIQVTEVDTYLSYLPASHVFERICGELYSISNGGVIAFAEGIEQLAKNMAEIQPTIIIAVPRILDRIYTKIRSGIDGSDRQKKALIEWALAVGKTVVQLRSEAKEPSPLLKAKHYLAERLVFSKLRARIGTRLTRIVCGGAPSNRETLEFFNAIGLTTLEGYGLTETAAPTNVNLAARTKFGTVGPCLPTVEMKLAQDGEILFRGPTIFQGYFKQEEATKEAFTDGWFHTGDIGTVDEDGYLKITDRKKDLIINAAGKNIAPQKIESQLVTIPCVNQVVVFGDKMKHLVAILTLDEQQAKEVSQGKGWTYSKYEDLVQSKDLAVYLREQISVKSKDLADYERVRNFAVLPNELSIEAGELTASLKVKRAVISKKYKEIIDSLHKEDESKVLASSKR